MRLGLIILKYKFLKLYFEFSITNKNSKLINNFKYLHNILSLFKFKRQHTPLHVLYTKNRLFTFHITIIFIYRNIILVTYTQNKKRNIFQYFMQTFIVHVHVIFAFHIFSVQQTGKRRYIDSI